MAKNSAYDAKRENIKDLEDTYGVLQDDIPIQGGKYVATGYTISQDNEPKATSPNAKTGYLYEKR